MMEWHAALDREVKFSMTDLSTIESDGSFSGYASLFGKEDLGRDVVMKGAFQNSLAKRGTHGIKMLYQHDPSEPIGLWSEIREDNLGLYVKGRLMQDVTRAREVLSLMREGVLDGLSIGFRTVRGKTDRKTGARHLHEIDLWEISVVTFPMLPDARVSSVKTMRQKHKQGMGQEKGQGKDHPTTREFERWLTREAGFSRSEARTIIRSGFNTLKSMQDAADDGPLVARMQRATQDLLQTRT